MPPRPRQDLRELHSYNRFLDSKRFAFSCPHCHLTLLPKEYQKHCAAMHGLNDRLCCVWCNGKISWPLGKKCVNAPHLQKCSRRFLNLWQISVPRPPPPRVPFDLAAMCPARDFFGRTPHPQPRAYDPVSPALLPSPPLQFTLESLNTANECLGLFLVLGNTATWYHAIVRSIAFPSFLRAMENDPENTSALPFSCWCDGGRHAEARHREHRHVIIVTHSERQFVDRVWKRIRIPREERPGPGFRPIHRDTIRKPLHFVNALGYVSQQKSICKLSGEAIERSNHFHVFQSLPGDYRLPLVMQWEGGLDEYLHQEYHNLGYEELVRAPFHRVEGKWAVKVRDIPGILFGRAVPLSPHFQPCDFPTPHFFHLLHGKKMYFRYRAIPPATDRVPPFYDAVGEELWTPRPFHQRLINAFKPFVDRNRELETQNAWLEEDAAAKEAEATGLHEQVAESQREATSLRKACGQWQKRHEDSQLEIQSLLKKVNGLNEEELARLKRENANLVQELEALRRTHEAELARLNRELEALKKENSSPKE